MNSTAPKSRLLLVLMVMVIVMTSSALLLLADRTTNKPIERQRQIASEAPYRAMLAELDLGSYALKTLPITQPKRSLLALGELESHSAKRSQEAEIYLTESSSGATPSIAILPSVAERGYGGPIELRIAIDSRGVVRSVVATQHRETPGLGDAIDREKSTWSDQFNGRSLRNTPAANWLLTSDDGVFDQITGATVTSRTVVDAVRRTLEYAEIHRARLFENSGSLGDVPNDG